MQKNNNSNKILQMVQHICPMLVVCVVTNEGGKDTLNHHPNQQQKTKSNQPKNQQPKPDKQTKAKEGYSQRENLS